MTQQNQILQKLESVEQLMKAETPQPLNLKQAAEYLSISKSYLYKLTCKNQITFFKPMGKLVFFNKADLDTFIFRNRQDTTSELEAQANSFVAKRKAGAK